MSSKEWMWGEELEGGVDPTQIKVYIPLLFLVQGDATFSFCQSRHQRRGSRHPSTLKHRNGPIFGTAVVFLPPKAPVLIPKTSNFDIYWLQTRPILSRTPINNHHQFLSRHTDVLPSSFTSLQTPGYRRLPFHTKNSYSLVRNLPILRQNQVQTTTLKQG